ncbi:MAG: hypothetical protein KAS18_01460, partial [Calditrichia bacterium]|nr:hypothetical protein [Calditrichia bacterium]
IPWSLTANSSSKSSMKKSAAKKVLADKIIKLKNLQAVQMVNEEATQNIKTQKAMAKEIIEYVSNSKILANEDTVGIVILNTPNDENTGNPAYTSVDKITIPITVQEAAQIEVLDDTSSVSLVSGGQSFTYSVKLDYSESVDIYYVDLVVSDTTIFEEFDNSTQNISSDSIASWVITVSGNITQVSQPLFSATAFGIDNNTGNGVSNALNPYEETITVRPRASIKLEAEIESPSSANTSRIVSLGQKVVLRAWAENAGITNATITGSGEISLTITDTTRFVLDPSSIQTQIFNSLNDTLLWTIFASDSFTVDASALIFDFNQLPQDSISNLPVYVAPQNGSKTISLSIRQRRLIVENLNDEFITETNFSRGEDNVPLLFFKVSNAGFGTPVNIWGLTFGFKEAESDDYFDSEIISNMFEYIEVIDYQEYLNRTSSFLAKPTAEFIRFPVDENFVNPASLEFTEADEDTILANQEDTLVVLVKIGENSITQRYRAVLSELYAYDVERGIPLEIRDTNGDLLSNSENLTSYLMATLPGNEEEGFFNHPNPFGRGRDTETVIAFSLDNESDVEIRIFTLIGKLVWTWKQNGVAKGLHNGVVRWDGKNDRGITVLNGVYLCQIKIKPNGGGSAKTYITKIAYIK